MSLIVSLMSPKDGTPGKPFTSANALAERGLRTNVERTRPFPL